MSEVLHKSAIITGCVNAFCLVCDSFFKSKEEAYSHVSTSTHAKNLCLFPYIDKFQDQNIRKVKAGYFCEYCNALLLTAMKTELHIAGEAHKQNRGTILVKPSEHGIIANNNVHIQERAWHGLKDDVCSLCDTEVEDEKLHIRDVSHILNLVQKPVKFCTNDAIYRLTDDSTLQCLTCNELLSVNGMSKHFVDDHHLDRYAKCKIEVNNSVDNIDEIEMNIDTVKILPDLANNSNVKEENPKISNEHNISNILSCVLIYRNNYIDVNFETDTAFCRKCCVDIQFDCNNIEKHIAAHMKIKRVQSPARYPTHIDKNTFCLKPKAHEMFNAACSNHNDHSKVNDPPLESSNNVQKGEKSDSDDDRESMDSTSTEKNGETELETNNNKCNFADVKVFAKENHITYNQQNSYAFCRICQVKLPSSLKSMKEHIQGAVHTKKVQKSSKVPPSTQTKTKHLKKQTMALFVHSVLSSDLYPEDLVINKRFCIKNLSLMLLIKNSLSMRCLLCEQNIYFIPLISLLQLRDHVASPGHRLKMDAVPVITSEPSEFIREIRPESFHCGYCNLVLSGWSEMENHLKCTDHIDNKSSQERIYRAFAFLNIVW